MNKRKPTAWPAISFGAHEGAATATGETRAIAARNGFVCRYFSWPPEGRRSLICEECPIREQCAAIVMHRPSYGRIDSETRTQSYTGAPRAYGTGIVTANVGSTKR